MLMQILSSTPKWVFVLFAALLWLGLQQMLPRTVGLNRATILPLAMTGLSLFGVISAFGQSPLALLVWMAGAAAAFAVSRQWLTGDVPYDPSSRRFSLPGSAVPLALFMGIFITKYAVGVSMVMQPDLAHNSSFALAVSTLYGGFSGVFLARAARLWRIALSVAQPIVLRTTHTPL
jgi:hypothetical protein